MDQNELVALRKKVELADSLQEKVERYGSPSTLAP